MDIDKLLSQLTIKEKCSLLVGKNAWETKNIDRLGIPSLFMADGPHGLRKVIEGQSLSEESIKAVCYPSMVTIASSFDPEISYKMGKAIAEEFKANDVNLILGPGINIKRHPFCGRNFEYYSEDPYVTSKMAEGFIKGAKSTGIGVCLKHYALNSQETYRMMSNSIVDERAKYEIYYKSFRKLLKLKPEMVMCSYNKVDGKYASENINLLKVVLRDEFGFNGVIVSDWTAVNDRTKALMASLDLEMPGYIYGVHTLIKDFNKGKVSIEMLDASVRRILEMVDKFKDQEKIEVDLEEHHRLSAELAEESMVLLRNQDNILPLKENEKILLLGEMADKVRYQGGGSSNINPYRIDTIKDCLLKRNNVDYLKGYLIDDSVDNKPYHEEAIESAAEYDKIIIVCGLPASYESEGYDREHLSIPRTQETLINRIAKVNPNVVLVTQVGSPIIFPFYRKTKAILNCYLGGEALGLAVDRVLYGDVNPSGRLAETFPKDASDIPSKDCFATGNNNVFYKESIYVGYRYYQTANIKVEYPFGYGKSYSHFEYHNLQLNKKTLKTLDDRIKLSVDVTNNSQYDGKEVVMLFFEPKNPKTPRPKRELIGFQKVLIKKGETETVTFHVKAKNLNYYHPEKKTFITDAGTYNLQICKNAREILVESPVDVDLGKEYIGSVWNSLDTYQIKNGLSFSKSDFEKLANIKYESESIKHRRPYDLNNCLADIQHTLLGKLFKNILVKTALKELKNADEVFLLMVEKGLLEQPLRTFPPFSGGMLKMNQVKAILAFINFRFIKGIYYLFRKD